MSDSSNDSWEAGFKDWPLEDRLRRQGVFWVDEYWNNNPPDVVHGDPMPDSICQNTSVQPQEESKSKNGQGVKKSQKPVEISDIGEEEDIPEQPLKRPDSNSSLQGMSSPPFTFQISGEHADSSSLEPKVSEEIDTPGKSLKNTLYLFGKELDLVQN